MKLIVVFAAVVLAVNASSDFDQWVAFKQAHGKTYKNLVEEQHRFSIFQNNLRTIEAHNAKYEAGKSLYTKKVNQFSDMTKEEFKQRLGRHSMPTLNDDDDHVKIFNESVPIPTSVDWRDEAVLEVKNQGDYGSSGAFSAIGALEGQNAIINGKKISLSVQQLLDCSSDYVKPAFEYVRDYGIETESSYPYTGKQSECVADSSKVVLKAKDYNVVIASEGQLAQAIATVGPISIAVGADHIRDYSGGIFETTCYSESDHAVLAVGYGEENGVKYWIAKNSWGESWGESGYIRLRRYPLYPCLMAPVAIYPVV